MSKHRKIRYQLMYAIANRLRVDVVLHRDPEPTLVRSGVPIEIVTVWGSTSRVVLDPGEHPDNTFDFVDIDSIAHVRQSPLTE